MAINKLYLCLYAWHFVTNALQYSVIAERTLLYPVSKEADMRKLHNSRYL